MADQTISYNEQMVGAGHPAKADTLNRLALVEHNTDGTHKSWHDVRNYASLTAAITAIDTDDAILMISNATTCTVNTTVPANVHIHVTKSGSIDQSTYTLAINGPFSAGRYQVFSGTGAVSFGQAPDNIFPEWWGAVINSSASAATNTTALASAVTAASGCYGVVDCQSGIYYYNGEFGEITDTMTFQGRGKRQTFFVPVAAHSGWSLTVNDCWRNAGVGEGPDTVVFADTKSGVHLKDFSIVGDRSVNSSGTHGIRTYQRVDQLTIENVDCLYLLGTGLSLGAEGEATNLGLLRESTITNVFIRGCGDSTYRPFILSNGDDAGDGTNQIDFWGFRLVYNYSRGLITSDAKDIRRIRFYGFMLHGLHTDASAPADDILEIKGRINDLKIYGLKTNGSHDVGGTKYATIRWSAGAGGTYWPVGHYIHGDTRACNGNGYMVDKVARLTIDGTADVSSIAGDELTVAASGIPYAGWVNYKVSSLEATRSISVDSTVANLVNTESQRSGDPPIRLTSGGLVLGDGGSASSANTPTIYFGTDADPNSNVTAPRRSLYFDISGDMDKSIDGLWIKAKGTGNTDWKRLVYEISDTATNIADAAATINTQGKRAGLQVWDTTNNRPCFAVGSGATANWIYFDGTAVGSVTPA